MSAFKDAVQADVKNIFLNIDEFAEEHDIDGETVLCIIDSDVMQGAPVTLEGVFVNSKNVYFASGDIVAPVEGEMMRIDGSFHIVQRVSDEDGVLVVTVTENDQ